jgi:hypothetical protein
MGILRNFRYESTGKVQQKSCQLLSTLPAGGRMTSEGLRGLSVLISSRAVSDELGLCGTMYAWTLTQKICEGR